MAATERDLRQYLAGLASHAISTFHVSGDG
jgi:hypothetical protein